MASLGVSGLSVALGLYNTSQISSLRSDLEGIINSTSTKITNDPLAKIDVVSPVTVAPVVVEVTPPIATSTFQDSESDEIVELQGKITALELFANIVSTRSTTNSSNISIKSDEIDNLNTFVGNQFVDVRARIATNEDSISLNVSEIENLDILISDVNTAALVTNDRIDANITEIGTINSSVSVLNTRMTTAESNIIQLSNDLTARGLDIDSLGDELSLEVTLREETSASLDNMYSLWNTFNGTAYVADNVLNANALTARNCKLHMFRENGAESALHYNGNDTSWTTFMAESGSGLGPTGDVVQGHGDITRNAVRMRLGNDSRDGYIFESREGVPYASIGVGGLSVSTSAKMGNTSGNLAAFGHSSFFSSSEAGFQQGDSGITAVSSTNSKNINFIVDGATKGFFNGAGAFTVNNDTSTNSTHFNWDGHNYIRTATGKSTYFSWGTGGSTVTLTDKKIVVDGVDLLAAIKTLQSQVSTLQSKSYIYNGTAIYLKNGSNGKYLRKASSNNDGIVDTSNKDDNSKFTVST